MQFNDIKKFRRSRKLTQGEFWSKIGVTQSGGSRYESGRGIPKPVKMLLYLAYATPKEARSAFNKLRGR